MSWWSEDVQFLKPKAERTAPKGQPIFPGLDDKAKYLALTVAALPAGLVLGTVLGKVARSRMGGYVGRSIVRGLIYKQIGALTGLNLGRHR